MLDIVFALVYHGLGLREQRVAFLLLLVTGWLQVHFGRASAIQVDHARLALVSSQALLLPLLLMKLFGR